MQDSDLINSGDQPLFGQKPDSFFGVCEAVGEDLGFSPFYLRVALLVLLIFSPVATIAAYAMLAIAVAATRWAFPKPRPMTDPARVEARVASERPEEVVEGERELVAA